jgi:PAS domain S-box-containing protein
MDNPGVETVSTQERQLSRMLIDSLPDYLFVKDIDSRIVLNNLAHAHALGVSHPRDSIGKTDFDFFPADLAKQYYEDEQALIRSGRELNREEIVIDQRTGATCWKQTSKVPLRDGEGKVIGLVGISRDITQRKVAEEKLLRIQEDLEHRVSIRTAELTEKNADFVRAKNAFEQKAVELAQAEQSFAQERNLLRSLIDYIPDHIYFKDKLSRFIRCGSAQAKLFHLKSPDELIGKSDFDFFTPAHAQPAFDDEQRIMQTGIPMVGVLEKETWPDGSETWVSTTKMPLYDPSGAIVGTFGVSRDVTAVKRTEQEMDRLHKELIHASRSAGMAEVATGVLHNVGNVLNSVNISASLIAEKIHKSKSAAIGKVAALVEEHSTDLAAFLTQDEKGKKLPAFLQMLAEGVAREQGELLKELTSLRSNIDHIKEIVAMQQNYARVTGLNETICAKELVEDALKLHSGAYLRHSVQLIRNYEEVPLVKTDKHKVLQILVNLLHNAKYACDESGRTDKKVVVRIAREDLDQVRIEVEDNGIGIPSENLTKVFTHGFTTRKDGHGFGLHSGALAAKELGGSLSVQSDGIGKGAKFVLTLQNATL